MFLITMIARLGDGLPLTGNVKDTDPVNGCLLLMYQKQAKWLLRKMRSLRTSLNAIASGQYLFYCKINYDVVYLTMCHQNFSAPYAFKYLDELASEFSKNYGGCIQNVSVPYAFIEFDVFTRKLASLYLYKACNHNFNRNDTTSLKNVQVINIEDFFMGNMNEGVILIPLAHRKKYILMDIRAIAIIGISLGITLTIIIVNLMQ